MEQVSGSWPAGLGARFGLDLVVLAQRVVQPPPHGRREHLIVGVLIPLQAAGRLVLDDTNSSFGIAAAAREAEGRVGAAGARA